MQKLALLAFWLLYFLLLPVGAKANNPSIWTHDGFWPAMAFVGLIVFFGIILFRQTLHKNDDSPHQSRKYLAALDQISQEFAFSFETNLEDLHKPTMNWLLKQTAKSIDVAQVSIWLFDRSLSQLEKQESFDARLNDELTTLKITRENAPHLLYRLKEERSLAISHAQTDIIGCELLKILPEKARPKSVLFSLIGTPQKPLGVLMSFTRQHVRSWNESDIHFSCAIADLIAFYLSTQHLHKAQIALSESEKRFRDLASAGSDWFWETDSNHRYRYFSNQFSIITGIEHRDIVGKSRLEFAQADPLTPLWAKHIKDLEDHRPFRDFQYNTAHNGKEIFVSVNGQPFYDQSGRFAGYRGTGSDISETKAFQTRFKESLNALPNGFMMWDAQDRLIMWNQTILEMLPDIIPYTNRNPRFCDLLDLSQRRGLIKFSQPFNELQRQHIIDMHKACGSHELELNNGRYLLVNEHPTSEGGIVGIYTDITALKEREKELLESKKISEILSSCSNTLFHARNESFILSEICRIITESFPFDLAWISLCDQAGLLPEFFKIDMVRGKELPLIRYSPSSIVKQVYIKQKHLVLNKSKLQNAYPEFKVEFEKYGIETLGIFPIFSDTKIIGFLNIAAIKEDTLDNRFISLVSELANDVGYGLTSLRSEQSRLIAEEALRESESRYRSLVDMSPDAILVLDESDHIVFSNPEGHVLFAATNRMDLFKSKFGDFLHTPENLFAHAPSITDDDPTQFISSVRLKRLNDTEFEADITARPVSYAGLTTRLLIIRDVTERNRVNEHLAQTSKLATLGEMAAGITHELSQPLNIMRFAAEGTMLKMQRTDVEPEEIQKKLGLISMQSARMADIIDHMRIFSRKDTGNLEVFDPTIVVRQSIDLIESQFLAEGVHLDIRYPPHYSKVRGRPIQLEQVILNLVNNARDAINQRHQTLSSDDFEEKRIIISMTYDLADHKINIAVNDNGGGIPEDALSKLFDPFFTTKEVGKGTGLGLSVSYGIIAAMGGTIRVRNIHKGARFDITLPCIEEKPPYLNTPAKEEPPLPETITYEQDEEDEDLDLNIDGAKVLVVDDEIYAAEAMMEYLFDQGYQVNIAGDGEEALEQFDVEQADVVVTDMRMPRMDGYVLIKELKKRNPELPVIVVTGHTGMEEINQQELSELAFKILKKPVSLPVLSNTVENALNYIENTVISAIED